MDPHKDLDMGKADGYDMIGHPHAKSVSFKGERTFNGVKYEVDVLVGFNSGEAKIAWKPTLRRTIARTHFVGFDDRAPTDAAVKLARAEVEERLHLIDPAHVATLDGGKRQVDRKRLTDLIMEASEWLATLNDQVADLDNGNSYNAYPERDEIERTARARVVRRRAAGRAGDGEGEG